MTHKEKCISYCFEYLNQRNAAFAFCFDTFSHYYRKNNGAWGNSYSIGMGAGDMMIQNYNSKTQEVKHERRTTSEESSTSRTF